MSDPDRLGVGDPVVVIDEESDIEPDDDPDGVPDGVLVALAVGVAVGESVAVPTCESEGVMDWVLEELNVAPLIP